MSSDFHDSRRATARRAWLPTVLLAGIGVVAGFYLAGPSTKPRSAASVAGATPAALSAESNAQDTSPTETSPERPDRSHATKLHRFPLSPADVKDTQGAPDIAVDGDGRMHLVWASITSETEQTCYFSSSRMGLDGFSSPQALTRSPIAYRSQGNGKKGYPIRMAPHVVAHGNSVSLTWSEKVPDEATVRMVLVESTDGSKFSEPVCVHVHPQARPTFTALAIGAKGELACSWLDGREATQHPFASVRRAGQREFASECKVPGGENGKGVCPCCPTGATFAPDGTLLVAFRNLVDGYRDLAIARLRPGESQFEGPFAVVAPTWKFDGCPHDGPSLVVAGGKLHATWMDAHTGVQRAYYGQASLDDLQFQAEALHADGPGTQGNPRLYSDAEGRIHTVWEESLDNEPATPEKSGHQHGPSLTGSGRGIYYAVKPPGAGAFESVRMVRPVAGTFQTRPAIAVVSEKQIYVAWCELNQDGKSIVVTSVAPHEAPQVTQGAAR